MKKLTKSQISWILGLIIAICSALATYLSSCSITSSKHFKVDSIKANGLVIDKQFGTEIKK